MKTKLIATLLLAGSSLFAGSSFSFSVGIGGPVRGHYAAAPPVYAYARPRCPGPGYTWVEGYWHLTGHRHVWNPGYWAPPLRYFRR